MRTISLDRLEASLAAAGIKPPSVPVKNDPPRVIVSNTPAILVPIDGAPVLKPVAGDSRFQRVINTRALILQGGLGQQVLPPRLRRLARGGFDQRPVDEGGALPVGMDDVAAKIAKTGVVDMLDGGPKANPKPSLANGVPTIYTSQVPTELIVFKGQPDFVPIVGTQLLWASNTTNDVLIDTATSNYYVLLAGRWFRSAQLTGPWTFVASNALPAGFAQIPTTSLAGRRAAVGRGNAAGAGSRDRELDSADGHGAAHERSEIHAQLRRSAAVRPDPGHAAHLRRQLVGAGHPGLGVAVFTR